MIKYRTKWYRIEPIEVLRETEKMVFLPHQGRRKEVREAKRSDWQNWYDTWEDAHQALLDEAQREVDSARLALLRAQEKYENIKGMKRP